MRKITKVFLFIIICILSVINVYAKEISIEDIHKDKSKIILENDEVIPEEVNILLIHKKGETIISVPKEAEETFNDYKVIGYEKDSVYYIYSDANNLIEKICDEINITKDKKIYNTKCVILTILGIILIFIYIIFKYIYKKYISIPTPLLSIVTIVLILSSCIIINYIAGSIIDNIKLKTVEEIEKQIMIYEQYID